MKQLFTKEKSSYYPELISDEIYLARSEFNKFKQILHFIAGLLKAFPMIKLIVYVLPKRAL